MATNLKNKGIKLEVTDELAVKVAKDGFEPEFGARPMKRIINLVLGDLLGKAILSDELKDGDYVKITPLEGKDQYSWEKVNK